jgi:hypothetical protein
MSHWLLRADQAKVEALMTSIHEIGLQEPVSVMFMTCYGLIW